MDILPLLRIIQDGNLHSGVSLAKTLKISRNAVNKQVQACKKQGILISTIKSKGYRLESPLSLLDEKLIREEVAKRLLEEVSITVLPTTPSTNDVIIDKHKSFTGHCAVCLAETQTLGRGRKARQWISPFGEHLYFSLGWVSSTGTAALDGLSLAIGLQLAQLLIEVGVKGVSLKWPNDVLVNGAKIAGILIELTGDANGPCDITIGIGINVNFASELMNELDKPWTTLLSELKNRPSGISSVYENGVISRNWLAILLTEHMIVGMKKFFEFGFSGFKADWQGFDFYYNKSISLVVNGKLTEGVGKGVDDRGEYRLNSDGRLILVSSGELELV